MTTYAELHTFACELAAEAGDYALDQLLQHKDISQKGEGIDVVTAVDVECERRIIDHIQARYPDHGITGEEHGTVCHADAEFRWLIDPLDGTNNYVIGMPMFGSCVTLLQKNEPVVAAFRNSVLRTTSSAFKGGGAFVDDQPATIGTFPDIPRTTISWTQGYVVSSRDPWVNDSLFKLESTFKRVLRTWSPSIDWNLIAGGHVGAFVTWKNELHDLVGGELMVRELGGEVWKHDSEDLIIAGAPEVVEQILNVIDLNGVG